MVSGFLQSGEGAKDFVPPVQHNPPLQELAPTFGLPSIKGLEGRKLFSSESALQVFQKLDDYTKLHSQRTADLAKKIASGLGLSRKDVEEAGVAGLFHDLGKIFVPREILDKKERLTDEEYGTIKKHASRGKKIVWGDFSDDVRDAVAQHHEKIDGTGYLGLKGDEISPLARILAVADAFDAMAFNRPYRKGFGVEEALHRLVVDSGTHFDQETVKALVNVLVKDGIELDEGVEKISGEKETIRVRNSVGEELIHLLDHPKKREKLSK